MTSDSRRGPRGGVLKELNFDFLPKPRCDDDTMMTVDFSFNSCECIRRRRNVKKRMEIEESSPRRGELVVGKGGCTRASKFVKWKLSLEK